MGNRTSGRLRIALWAVALLIACLVLGFAGRIHLVGQVLSVSWLPALAVALIIVAVGLAVGAAFPWPVRSPRELADPEPLLPIPAVPDREAHPFVLAIRQLETRSGSSTLAFNISVKIATDGIVDGQRPRPLCLLSEGELTKALGLNVERLRSYLIERPVSPDEDVLDLTVRHPSGSELLCIGAGVPNGQQLRLLLPILRRYYDPIIIDCRSDDRWFTEVAIDASDVLLLIGLRTPDSAAAAARWADAGWERGITGQMAEVLNRVRANPAESAGLGSGLQYRASIPEDPMVVASDGKGMPWILDFESRAATAATNIVQKLLPRMMVGRGAEHAA